ncbi:MAG: DUF2330 domain-containing protein [Fimbriimonadaceae bacterium]
MRARGLLAAGLAAAMAGTSASAFAVGLFCGPPMAAAPPTIPYARAYISHRDGVQTMIVDAAIYGPPGRYAWIIAVPAKPEVAQIRDGDPLGALVEKMPPAVGPDDSRRWRWAAWAALLGLGLAITAPWRLRGDARANLVRLGLESLVSAGLVGAAWAFGGVGMQAEVSSPATTPFRDAPQILNRTMRGGRVDVIESPSPTEMANWFRTHGAAPTRDARPVMDAAIRQGWSFVAVTPTRHDGRAQVSAPVEIVFPTPEPVLPLRLTGAGQRHDLVLDLFVSGTRPARADRAERWVLDPDPDGKGGGLAMQRASGLPVAGGTLTRLRARLPSELARRDLTIGWEEGPVPSPGPVLRENQVRSRAELASTLAAWVVVLTGVGLGYRRGWTPMPMVGWLVFLAVPVFLAVYRQGTFAVAWVEMAPPAPFGRFEPVP